MLYHSIIFFVIIVPITTQSMTIEIEGLAPLLTSLLDRFIGVIDPTIDKFQNATTEILSILENRITVNISETLYWLETNLFVVLFTVIVFFIFVLILLNLLDTILVKYDFLPEKRRFAGLALITIIFVWLFIAMVLSTWLPAANFDLQILKYILVGLLSIILLVLLLIWMWYLYNLRTQINQYFTRFGCCDKKNTILMKGRSTTGQENIELTHDKF
ncbi:unnamed protein product [Rotaria sp. Silwood1]|nr:unnamed protein product [Rotaria sp. Silwood1]